MARHGEVSRHGLVRKGLEWPVGTGKDCKGFVGRVWTVRAWTVVMGRRGPERFVGVDAAGNGKVSRVGHGEKSRVAWQGQGLLRAVGLGREGWVWVGQSVWCGMAGTAWVSREGR